MCEPLTTRSLRSRIVCVSWVHTALDGTILDVGHGGGLEEQLADEQELLLGLLLLSDALHDDQGVGEQVHVALRELLPIYGDLHQHHQQPPPATTSVNGGGGVVVLWGWG